MKIPMQHQLMPRRLPTRNRFTKTLVALDGTFVMKLRHDEDAAALHAVRGEKLHLLRNLRMRARMGIMQRNDQRFGDR